MAYDTNALYECLEEVYEDEPFDFPAEDSGAGIFATYIWEWINPLDLDPATRNWIEL